MAEEREELLSRKVVGGSRSYFIDVKESREGVRYLVISESRLLGEHYEHQRVMVLEENIPSFKEAMESTFEFLGLGVNKAQKQVRFEDIRKQFPRAYEKWTPEEDDKLRRLLEKGADVNALAEALQRQPGAVTSRLRKLGLARSAP